MKRRLALILLFSAAPAFARGKSDTVASQNRQKAQQALAATIQALGGPAWVNLKTMESRGRSAAFYQGKPTGIITAFQEMTQFPDSQRIDLAPKGRVVQIYVPDADGHLQGWEITYQGKKRLSATQLGTYVRWHNHSLGVALRQWFTRQGTVLLDDGPGLVNRHSTDEVTLLGANDDSITLDLDTENHLPLRLSFAWRDPQFHDKNVDAVEYDNYHTVQGIATPLTVTWIHNGETVRQRFLSYVKYNLNLAKNTFDPDAAAAKAK